MLTSSGPAAFYTTMATARLHYPKAERTARVRDAAPTHNFDSVSISAPTAEGRLQRGLVSRLSNEIRTATTTGDIQTLKAQVSSGTYEPDADAIAAKMLLLGGR